MSSYGVILGLAYTGEWMNITKALISLGLAGAMRLFGLWLTKKNHNHHTILIKTQPTLMWKEKLAIRKGSFD